MKDGSDELGEVDGVDQLVAGVDAEEDGWGGVFQRVGGVVGVGEVVAGERDDDLGAAGGENALVAMGGVRVAAYQRDLMKGRGRDGGCAQGRACIDLGLEHISMRCLWVAGCSCCDCRTIEDGLKEDWKRWRMSGL